jgi:hypothetical protein
VARPPRIPVALALPLALFACTNIGPGTIARDRFDYSSAITESWKRQTLLNIVKLRYLDPPIFVDVGQIVSGYTLESALSASGAISHDPAGAALGGTSAALGGSIRYTDRPTITYVPMTGNKFVRALMTPLPPESVFQAIASGWAADGILVATVNTINGLENQHASLEGATPPEPKFLRVLQLLREMQVSGAIGMRVRKEGPPGAAGTLLVVRKQDAAPELREKGQELRQLLGLDADAEDFTLAFGATAQNPRELAVVTRSVLHILMAMSMGVDVPDADVQDGRAVAGPTPESMGGRLLRVHSATSSPADAYVAVAYRDHWFWIDDRDLRSKRAFAFMMMLFTMSDPSGAENAPMITIPA